MTDLDTLWAVAAREPLEVVELEERLDDEPICQANGSAHDEACRIVACATVRATCSQGKVTLLVCSEVVRWLGIYEGPCPLCWRLASVCWVVTEL